MFMIMLYTEQWWNVRDVQTYKYWPPLSPPRAKFDPPQLKACNLTSPQTFLGT